MCYGIYYITSKHLALKLFTGVTFYDLSVLGMLQQVNAPVHFSRLHDLLVNEGYTIDFRTFSTVLKNGVENGLISRTPLAGNVLYCITLDGKKLLRAFAMELDSIVRDKVRKYGNGLDLD